MLRDGAQRQHARRCLGRARARKGGKAVAEGAVLEARPAVGQADPPGAARGAGRGSMLVVRCCELCMQDVSPSHNLEVMGGSKATAADCSCSGQVLVLGQGSSLCWCCEPCVPDASPGDEGHTLGVMRGARATDADCICSGQAVVHG
jgi:hypothetical protein